MFCLADIVASALFPWSDGNIVRQRTSTTWFHRYSAVPELMAKASALVGVPFEEGRWEEAQTVRTIFPGNVMACLRDFLGKHDTGICFRARTFVCFSPYSTEGILGSSNIALRSTYNRAQIAVPRHDLTCAALEICRRKIMQCTAEEWRKETIKKEGEGSVERAVRHATKA